jgi:hypothetical protein
VTDALRAVVDAAIERALVDDGDARRHFALAGALERVRVDESADADRAGTDGDGPYRDTHRDGSALTSGDVRGESKSSTLRTGAEPSRTESAPADAVSTGRLGAALASTLVVRALGATSTAAIDSNAWVPGGDPQSELVVVGARLALRRFEIDVETVASRSGVPHERLADAPTAGENRYESIQCEAERPNEPRE